MGADGKSAPSAARELEHLDGARCLAALWIVCAHYLPKSGEPPFNGAVYRVNVAICFFVVASGFVTHWAYAARDLSSLRGVLHYYARRLGRVVFTFWVAMAFACCVSALQDGPAGLEFWYLVRCFLFLEQWVRWCPNGPSWFVFAMLPAWILYPVTRRVITYAGTCKGGGGLYVLMLLLWAISFGPAVVLFIVQGGNITMQQHHDMSFWPPAQLADFALGACTAGLAQRRLRGVQVPAAAAAASQATPPAAAEAAPGREGECWLRWLTDLSMACVLAVVFCAPRPSGTWAMHLNGWEPLLDHGLAPPLALFMYGAAVGCGGVFTRLLRHGALAALGLCSFEVYIFQRPVHDVFRLLFAASSGSMEAFLAYLLTLWLFAGLYARFVQEPFDRWLRGVTSSWASPPRDDYVAVGEGDASVSPLPGDDEFSPDWKSGVRVPPL